MNEKEKTGESISVMVESQQARPDEKSQPQRLRDEWKPGDGNLQSILRKKPLGRLPEHYVRARICYKRKPEEQFVRPPIGKEATH